ncbi:MAG: hypothetical protein WCH21_06230 [Bacteroidota bacterium]
MLFKKSVGFLLIMLASAALSFGLFYKLSPKDDMTLFGKGNSYLKLWKKVDSCQNKGLTQSALTIVEAIYEKAKSENNASQFVKAVLNRMKFESYKEEFSLEKSIFKLRDEANASKYPIKPVLQSILADAFWQYFQNNRWKFYDRTTTVGFKNDDIETWDLKTITNAVIVYYKASLENADSLKRTKIDIYDDVLNKGTQDCRYWRPTLYDFLAHRALSFFMSSELDLARPSAQFNVNNAELSKPFSEFVNVKITNPSDSLELKYYALKLMQDLTLFHQKDENANALIDVELLRLDYVHRNSQNPKKDTLYFNALKFIQDKFSKNERVTEVDFRMAS